MAVSEARKRAKQKYVKENYDLISLYVRKGKKDFFKAVAEEHGLGLRELLRAAVEEFIENHEADGFIAPFKEPPREERLPLEQRRLLENFEKLPQETQELVLKLVGNAAKIAEGKEVG